MIKRFIKKIMIWLQDINWPGSEIIFDYITKNINVFYSTIRECVFETLKNKDEAWLSSLLAIIYKSKGLSDTEISFILKKIQYYIEINDKDSLYNFINNIFD